MSLDSKLAFGMRCPGVCHSLGHRSEVQEETLLSLTCNFALIFEIKDSDEMAKSMLTYSA